MRLTFSIEPLWHAPDKFTISLTGSVLNLLASCIRISECNIGRDGPRKEDRILGHHTNDTPP